MQMSGSPAQHGVKAMRWAMCAGTFGNCRHELSGIECRIEPAHCSAQSDAGMPQLHSDSARDFVCALQNG